MLEGIDISYWQKDNYKYLIDKYAKDFVICRAGFNFSVDSTCDIYYQYAKSKGKLLGFYFFPLCNNSTPEEHALWAYNQVKNYIHDAIPILDWEYYAENGVTYNDVSNVDWAYEWLREFERLSGVKPIIYMSQSVTVAYNWSKVVENNNGLWVADYGNNDGNNHGFGNIGYWPIVAMHQYTSVCEDGGLDRDVFFATQESWGLYADSKGTVPTPIKPTNPLDKYSDEELANMVINGDFGNGEERKQKLGNRYDAVQKIVNHKLGADYVYYTIKAGDTLSGIAFDFGTTVQNICSLNGISNPDLIYAGATIRVK